MYVDEFASMGSSPEQEYAEIKEYIGQVFPDRNHRCKPNVRPHELKNSRFDIYVMDVGGLCYVDYSGTQRDRFARDLAEQVRDHPSALFLIWSHMTSDFYWDAVRDSYPELLDNKNVIDMQGRSISDIPDRDDLVKRIREWFNDEDTGGHEAVD